MCIYNVPCPRLTWTFLAISEKLGAGYDLPRMKRAQLVNSVLKMQEVSMRNNKTIEAQFLKHISPVWANNHLCSPQGFIALFSDAEVLLTESSFNPKTNRPVWLIHPTWTVFISLKPINQLDFAKSNGQKVSLHSCCTVDNQNVYIDHYDNSILIVSANQH